MNYRATAVLLFASTLAACAAQDTGTEEPTAAGSESELVATVMADTADVRSDRVIFKKSTVPAILRSRITAFERAIASGKTRADVENVILAGDRGKDALDGSGKVREESANPYGFIRRALSIHDEGNDTVILTEGASLDDAFAEFNEGRIVRVGPQTQNGNLTPQLSKQLHYTIPVINVDGKELYKSGDTSVRVKSGSVTLDTTVDLSAGISWMKLQDAHVVIDADVDSELIVEAQTAGAFANKTIDGVVYRGSWPIGAIGPVPVTLGVVATVGCTFGAKGQFHGSAGVGMAIAMKGGVEYKKDKGTSPVFEAPRFTPRAIAPVVDAAGEGSVRCFLRPQLSVRLFDAAGPTLTPDLAAKLTATAPPVRASLVGEVGLDVGGALTIFGKDLGQVNYHLFTVDKELWHN